MIDIIIPTYGRIKKAFLLAESIISSSQSIRKIIIVDSTKRNEEIKHRNERILVVRTQHQNQPYQRYLGYTLSESDLLIFLDDDMEVVDNAVFQRTLEIFQDNRVIAVAYNFEDKHTDTTLSRIPQSVFPKNNSFFGKVKSFITGYPTPAKGKYGNCGIRGNQPDDGGFTELISGGAFAARRRSLYRNFNFQLFDLYEKRLGKGEDGILGFTLSKQGLIFYYRGIAFLHNDQKDSIYSADIYSYSKRVSYSRLFLTLERARLNEKDALYVRIHFHYYMFCRIIGSLINLIIKSDDHRKHVLRGTVDGWRLSFGFRFDKELERQNFWRLEGLNDVRKQNF